MKSPISDIITGCKSYKALRDEIDLAHTIHQKGWSTTVGPIYKDVLTNKLREIDVKARRSWMMESDITLSAHVVIFCESKCISGSHLFFSESPSSPSFNLRSNCYSIWEGQPTRERELRLLNMFKKLGLGLVETNLLLDRMESMAFPNQCPLVQKLLIPPCKAEIMATTYKETTIDKEKNTDNSVLWRACQCLNSTMRSSQHAFFEATEDDLEYAIRKRERDDCVGESFTSAYKHRISLVMIYHPIVVIDAKLWHIKGNSAPVSINSCRYVQQSVSDDDAVWYDIVNREHVKSYVNDITSYYNDRFRQAGCLAGIDPDVVLDIIEDILPE